MAETPAFEWRDATGKYASGKALWSGQIMLATASYDSMVSKDSPNKYKAASPLPQVRESAERFSTIDEAMAAAERKVTYWFGALRQALPSLAPSLEQDETR